MSVQNSTVISNAANQKPDKKNDENLSSLSTRDYLLLGGVFTLFGFLLVTAVFLQFQYGESIFFKKMIAGIANCF
ncbi:MAG: hypothetical protein ACR2OW_00775 [Methyloligellaceae bacterium]